MSELRGNCAGTEVDYLGESSVSPAFLDQVLREVSLQAAK